VVVPGRSRELLSGWRRLATRRPVADALGVSNDALQTTLALVSQSAEGSERAFTMLFERCVGGVRRAAMVRLGALGDRYRAECEDIVQEVFAAAFARIADGKFDSAESEGSFRHYLAEMVKGKVVDLARRQHAERRGGGRVHELDAVDSALRDAAFAHSQTPTKQLRGLEDVEAVRVAMLHLKDEYRRVLDLHDFCGMTYPEIAAHMGYQRVEPVRLLVHRARSALARRLEHGAG
jgi:RNA polymerase sigma factor (sigma-70 family)